jgi:integrase
VLAVTTPRVSASVSIAHKMIQATSAVFPGPCPDATAICKARCGERPSPIVVRMSCCQSSGPGSACSGPGSPPGNASRAKRSGSLRQDDASWAASVVRLRTKLDRIESIGKRARRSGLDMGCRCTPPCSAVPAAATRVRSLSAPSIATNVSIASTAARGRGIFVPTLLAVLGGLRRGEIAALRWREVDRAARLSVIRSAEQTRAGVRYKEPKSGQGRTITLPNTLVTELRAHRVAQAEELLRFGKRLSDDDFVVTQADGSSLRPHSLGQEWVRFLARTRALPRIRFHDLRNAHATHLLASGVHPKVASERLGHSKVGITLDLYSHVLPNMQADAAAIVDGALRAVLNRRGEKG